MMRPLRAIWAIILACCALGAVWLVAAHPDSPLPRQWNPLARLHVSDPVTPLTSLKLNAATKDPELCLAVLTDAEVAFTALPPLEQTPVCHIRNRVALDRLGQAALRPVETSCAVALRLAMWERHGLRAAADQVFGQSLAGIAHLSSYSCRALRLPGGSSRTMSTHATAAAIDIAGFTFSDGSQISLIDDWAGSGPKAAFLRAARDSACDWFSATLGPEFNALHADHFHLQASGWGTCR